MQAAAFLPAVIELARAAGADILEIYAGEFEVHSKRDATPVTAADMAAHRRIVDGLGRLSPRHPVLSEESADEFDYAERATWNPYWLVDPLDGTKEFVKRNGEFTVNIALIDDNLPVLGVVHVPVTGVTYYAADGAGAFKALPAAAPVPIAVCGDERVPRVVGSRSHRDPHLDGYLERLGEHRLRAIGSSLKFCLLAEGEADVYPRFGPTCEWDTAAAHAIVRAAGGRVVQLDGNELRYNAKPELLNPHFVALGNPNRRWLDFVAAP